MKEQETLTVYKAVRVVEGGWFVSSITGHPAFPETKDWELEYVLGEETVAHEGSIGILCFSSAKTCVRYLDDIPLTLRYGHEFAILECTTTHAPRGAGFILNNRGGFSYLVTHYEEWRRETIIGTGAGIGIAPYNTRTVPSLTPRRIYKEDTR